MAIIGEKCHWAMFCPIPPDEGKPAAWERFKRVTAIATTNRSTALRLRGSDFPEHACAHLRFSYSHSIQPPQGLTQDEICSALDWGDPWALAPELFLKGEKLADSASGPLSYKFDYGRAEVLAHRFCAAMEVAYGPKAFTLGAFLDADVPEIEYVLPEASRQLRWLGCPLVLLNAGRMLGNTPDTMERKIAAFAQHFDGVYLEAVQVGRADEDASRTKAEMYLQCAAPKGFIRGLQIRFAVSEPTPEEVERWANWFLSVRTSGTAASFYVDYRSGDRHVRRELPCPDALDPQRVVQAIPISRKPKRI